MVDDGGLETALLNRLFVTIAPLAICAVASSACGGGPTAASRNAPPSVTVAFEGPSSCSLRPGSTCTIPVVAQATDPDGDPLRYAWSGCAAGTSARAVCTVGQPGQVSASVEVTDDHGNSTRAAAVAEGTAVVNTPPSVAMTFEGSSTCALSPGRSCTLRVLAQATDPDEDPLQYIWSGCATGTAPRAECTVVRPGPVVASVAVSDDHGHTATATITGEGVSTPNSPPTVNVVFRGASACTPLPGRPCNLDVAVQASDPDGDALRYQWSGCASGTGSSASCTVATPGRVEAIVQVTDEHGLATTATAVGTGTNRPPGVQIGYISRYPSSTTYGLLGNVLDPDEGFLCGRQYCESASASGACRLTRFDCSCLGGLEADVAATAASGLCTVTFALKDSWGQVGTPIVTFDLANPRPPSVSSSANNR